MGIETVPDPDVAKQSIDHAGHAAESGAADEILSEVGHAADDEDQHREEPGALPAFQGRAEKVN